MPRLSVSLDEETAGEIEELPASIRRLAGEFGEEELARFCMERPGVILRLARSITDLGDHPSTSAILRQAAKAYISLARDLETTARLERGYVALARDQERQAVLEPLVDEAASRWADEP